MRYPKLKELPASYRTVDCFGGYNANAREDRGEFADMKNMTGDHYPVLAPRAGRGFYRRPRSPQGIIAKEQLCYVDGEDFYCGDEKVPVNLSVKAADCPKQLISMGAYVIILPDKKYVNTKDLTDFGDIEAEFVTEAEVSFTPCEGEEEKVRIEAPAIGAAFNLADAVSIEGVEDETLQKLCQNAVICQKGDDFIEISGTLETPFTQNGIRVRRSMPLMDFLTESGNRLWGCRYGADEQGNFVNEIYACKLGDFRNWNCFQGLSTDSYRASCGTDGPFTGACAYLGSPLFFKERCIHKIYGSYPAVFRMQDTACRGVQKGCHGSLAMVGETLLYRARGGVCAYDGSLPVDISRPLGDCPCLQAVAGSAGDKYYISMEHPEKGWQLFVFDTVRALWHKEDDLHAVAFAALEGQLYCIDGSSCDIITMHSETGEPVQWMVQTGPIGMAGAERNYVSRLDVRLQLEAGSQARLLVRYDSGGDWQLLCTLFGTRLRSYCVPVRPRRCDHLELRLEGAGMAKLYSITKKRTGGSDAR